MPLQHHLSSMQCSTGCGNPAASDCRKEQCGRCCVGCRRHPRKLPPPGEPGSCECGQTASPNCADLLCNQCCDGCSWHGYDSTHSEESDVGYYVSSAPAHLPYRTTAQQTMCTCGQTASPLCDYFLCASCCYGCSRHAGRETEEESEAGPQPGQPGSCSCGQTASPLCDHLLCASCCHGCSRHFVPETEEEEEPEADPYQPPPQQQHLWCGGHCGQHASPSCAVGRCRNCCSAAPSSAACCSYHSNRMLPPQYDSDTDSLDYGQSAPAQTAAQQQQQQQRQRCSCGQFAAAMCSMLCCASCCHDVTCSRHGVSRLESFNYDAELCIMPALTLADARPNDLAIELATYGFQNPLSLYGSGAELDMRAGQAQPQPPSATRAAPTAESYARGTSAASRDTGRAAGQPDQQQGSTGAGPSSSSSSSGGSVAKTGMPASEAEEALFQLKHCVVCLDEPRSVLLLPCKHLVLCAGCMVQMQRHARQAYAWGDSDNRDIKCPVCRETAAHMLPGIILS